MSERFTKWAKDGRNKKYVWLIIGLLILVLSMTFIPVGSSNKTPVQTVVKEATSKQSDSYEDTLEKKLEAMLSKMEGVGEVSVMVTTISNEEKILAEDTTTNIQRTEEKDQSGGTRVSESNNTTRDIVLQNGNTPYIVKEYTPVIKGVFILAEGADDSEVKGEMTEAVTALLDVPVHKISIEKRK